MDEQLAAYRVDYDVKYEATVQTYMVNGAHNEVSSSNTASDSLLPTPSSCTPAQLAYRNWTDLICIPLTKGMSPLEMAGWLERFD